MLVVSLDGPEREHDDLLRRRQGSYARVLGVLDGAARRGLATATITVLSAANLHVVDEVLALAERHAFYAYFQPAYEDCFRHARGLDPALGPRVLADLAGRLGSAKRAGKPVGASPGFLERLARGPAFGACSTCSAGRYFATVMPDGTLVPCHLTSGDHDYPNGRRLGFAAAFRALPRPKPGPGCAISPYQETDLIFSGDLRAMTSARWCGCAAPGRARALSRENLSADRPGHQPDSFPECRSPRSLARIHPPPVRYRTALLWGTGREAGDQSRAREGAARIGGRGTHGPSTSSRSLVQNYTAEAGALTGAALRSPASRPVFRGLPPVRRGERRNPGQTSGEAALATLAQIGEGPVRSDIGTRLDQIGTRLDQIGTRLDLIGTRLDQDHDAPVRSDQRPARSDHDAPRSDPGTRLDQIMTRLDQISGRLDQDHDAPRSDQRRGSIRS